jgi:4'-phosphopantetheinyl transferase
MAVDNATPADSGGVIEILYQGVDPAAVERARWVVSDEELEAASRFLHEEDSSRFLVSRALTRLALADTLGTAPRQIAFSRVCDHCGDDRHGRPRLSAEPTAPHFSVTRAGPVVAIAIADQPIGLDAEPADRRSAAASIGTQVFSDADRSVLAGGSRETRSDRALALFVAKEAVGKLSGHGLERAEAVRAGLPLAAWASALDAGGQPCQLVRVEIPGTAHAALAVRSTPAAVRVRQYEPEPVRFVGIRSARLR